jgi:signal transduction histidine kinase
MLYIRPPYWQTWWFIALVMAAVLALVGIGTAGYYRYRLREQQLDAAQRERALEQERYELERKNLESEKELALRRQRDRVSSDMHDELGGGLVSIGAQSKRAQKFQPPPEVQSILARIGDIAYHLNRNMRNLSWATDPEMDNLSSLLSRLRKETRDFMEDHALEGHIDLPTDFEDLRLSGEFRLHLLRATLEALNNVAKHAQATSVSLTATVGTHLRLALQDNGIGFDPETKIGTSKGLRSMTKRMEALNGTITWLHNEAGQGMTVVMEVPLD